MEKTPFEAVYARLNPEQKDAVDTIEGPVMVIAGPGTGKTQILTLRIARILEKTDVQPENILALTFTESGARAMRERLVSYIGAAAYRVGIHTFHEFAGTLIRTYPDAYTRAVGGRPITDLEKITLIESILETPSITLLRPRGNPQFYVKPIMSAISLMKREYITVLRFGEIIQAQEEVLNATPKLHEKGAHKGKPRSEYINREKALLKNKELHFIYNAYMVSLSEGGKFDYDDMIFETVEALTQNEDMLRSLQEQYQYILADEHQDVNGSQNKILELLASFHDRPNIFVVGDEKQSIYRFQGASLENFLYFDEKFPHTKTIALTKNYRSAQKILDLSHAFITVEAGAADKLRVPLVATIDTSPIIERTHMSHEAVEHDALIQKIKGLVDADTPLEEIAIIVRTNREVEEFSSLLRKQGIAAEASADGDILNHPITTQLRTLINAVVKPYNEQCLFQILQSGYSNIPLVDLVKIMNARSYDRPLSQIIDDSAFLSSIGVQEVESVRKIPRVLQNAREEMTVHAPHRVLENLLHSIGFIAHALALDPYEGSRVIRRLYDEIEEMVRHTDVVTLSDVEHMLTTHIEHGLPLNAPYIRGAHHAVQVMTAHKAKGLEFMHVFIPHLTDSRWGGKAHAEYFTIPVTQHLNADDFAASDDERKILYVAMTRAKIGLYLSDSETSAEGRTLTPTRLLEGVTEKVGITTIQSEEDHFDPLTLITSPEKTITIGSEFLYEILKEHGLSATALNNYLRDPWNYFYRNVLRIPEVQSESAQFGTVLHDTLRNVMKHRREKNELPTASELKTYIERQLGKHPLTLEEYTRYHERALLVLTNYMEHIKETLNAHATKEEYKIETLLQTGDPDFPELRLKGLLDRLDVNDEGAALRVIDYKSGKAKTRGYIEGKTKDSTGDYKRQLTFYALLLSLQNDEKLKTREYTLSFIEPDEKGKIHDESYTITDAEIDELKVEIIRVAKEIRNGAFLNAPCDPLKSDYCDLVTELRRRS